MVLLLIQFVWPPQQYFSVTPLASPSYDLSAGLALRTLCLLASVAARSFSFPLKHRIPQNHQRVFPPPLRRLWCVSSRRMPHGSSPSTPSRFADCPGVLTTREFPFYTHLIVTAISAPQRAYTRHIWRVFPAWVLLRRFHLIYELWYNIGVAENCFHHLGNIDCIDRV